MRPRQFFWNPAALMIVLLVLCAFLATSTARAQTFTVLHSFGGGAGGKYPYGGLVRDAAGNLYGTTREGGDISTGNPGYGMVFELASPGKETGLYSFQGGADGSTPYAGLIFDGSGNLYGTTYLGGTGEGGTVFKLTQSGGVWAENVLHGFAGEPGDGSGPFSALVMDAEGNLYGTTPYGGLGRGTVFELNSSGTETLLFSFPGGSDGDLPKAGLLMDAGGNLYGTTVVGGVNGSGTVFKLTPSDGGWTESVLYSFQGGADGRGPEAGLIMDGAGNLYGTTYAGGSFSYGAVFKLAPSGSGWTQSVVYSFQGGTDGAVPKAGLVMDTAGNLYGTTSAGGGTGNNGSGYGTVFSLDKTGKETILHSFTGGGRWWPSGLWKLGSCGGQPLWHDHLRRQFYLRQEKRLRSYFQAHSLIARRGSLRFHWVNWGTTPRDSVGSHRLIRVLL
jgi:uncharacterized repeat protein (TIGR03803 family)